MNSESITMKKRYNNRDKIYRIKKSHESDSSESSIDEFISVRSTHAGHDGACSLEDRDTGVRRSVSKHI